MYETSDAQAGIVEATDGKNLARGQAVGDRQEIYASETGCVEKCAKRIAPGVESAKMPATSVVLSEIGVQVFRQVSRASRSR